MKLRPLHDRVVIRRSEEERKPLAVSFCRVRLLRKPTAVKSSLWALVAFWTTVKCARWP